jgi:hypothetical protein
MERAARAIAADPEDVEPAALPKSDRRPPDIDLEVLDAAGFINRKTE